MMIKYEGWAKPTNYSAILFKSKLEAKFANFCDILGIKWEYEPRTFLLSNNEVYVPDFYLNELKLWVECKADFGVNDNKKWKTFILDLKNRKYPEYVNQYSNVYSGYEDKNDTEFLFVTLNNIYFLNCWNDWKEGDYLQIGLCSRCKKYFFCENIGIYNCRCCGYQDGDHDIVYLNDTKRDNILNSILYQLDLRSLL